MTTSILFVCRANLCRSPSAEVMLTRTLAGTEVDAAVASAGLEVVEGQVPPDDFVAIALDRGIDLRAHRPTPFSKEDASASDLVLAMTRSLLRTMVLSAPVIWPRSFTLSKSSSAGGPPRRRRSRARPSPPGSAGSTARGTAPS